MCRLKSYRIPFLLLLLTSFCFADDTGFRRGFSYLKWGSQFIEHADRSFSTLKETGATWVSFVPIYYMENVKAEKMYRHPVLSPTDEELIASIRKAKDYGFKVLLKPHIDVMRDPWSTISGEKEAWLSKYREFIDKYPITYSIQNSGQNWFDRLFDWRGKIRGDSKVAIQNWFNNYRAYITHFAALAADLEVDLFCIGTEFEKLSDQTGEWKKVVAEVRKIYKGKIFYDANHDGMTKIKFWGDVDLIGVSGYFPISKKLDPSEEYLRKNMNSVLDTVEKSLNTISVETRKTQEVIFGEAGYTDFRGTTREPWKFVMNDGISESEQALAYKVSIEAYEKKPWLKGVFFWRWSVEPSDKYFDYDHYSPFGKSAESEIKKKWRNTGFE